MSIESILSALGSVESGNNYYSPPHMDEGFWNLGGRFQILEDNWASWAVSAGLSPDAPYTPENQDIVARHIAGGYYNTYGTPELVASAWNGGAGGADSYKKYGDDSYMAGYVAKFQQALKDAGNFVESRSVNTSKSTSGTTSKTSVTGTASVFDSATWLKKIDNVVYIGIGVVVFVLGFYIIINDKEATS